MRLIKNKAGIIWLKAIGATLLLALSRPILNYPGRRNIN